MTKSIKIASLLGLLLLPSLNFAQQEFLKNYPTVYDRTGRDLMRNTTTGEYLFVGASNNSNPADGDLYVMRTSADGTFLWDTVYGGSKPDYAYSMTDTDDGNYIVVGFSQSRPGGGGDYDIYMLKLSPSGRKLKEVWYDVDNKYRNDEARAVIRKGSDYYVIGSTGMPPSSTVKSDMVLLKMDNNLVVSETHTYGGTNHEYGLAIVDANDGGFLIAGQTLSEGAGMGDAYVIKLNSLLTKEWSKTYGDQYDEEVVGVAVDVSNDGTAMLAIRDSMPGAATDGNIDVVLQQIKMLDGSPLAVHTYSGTDKDTPKTIRSVSTGGYIVGAISRSWWPSPQMWPIRVNTDGSEIWKYDYGDYQEHDHCHMIKEDYDGRFIATGHQRLGGIMKVAFLRLSSSGTVDIKESSKILTGIKAYPNPSSDGNISLSFSDRGEYEVEIVNMMGQQIQKNVVNLQQPGAYSLQLPSTGAGIYIVNIKAEEGTFTARLIVQ